MNKRNAILSKISKIMLAMLVMIFLATSVSAQLSKFSQITVTLINQEPDPVPPGGTVKMRFRIENEGSKPAEDTEAKLVLKYPFSFYGEEEEIKSLGTIAGNQIDDLGVREEWELLVDSGATTGEDIVELWYRINNGIWTKAGDYTVTIRSRDAVLAINEIKTDKENIIPGTMTRVAFVMENLADNTLSDIKLNLDIYSQVTTTTGVTFIELPFTPIGSGNEKTLKNLAPGESKEIVFNLFTDAEAESKAYKVPYTLAYSDASGVNFSREGVLGLVVESTPDLSVNIDSTEIYKAGAKGKVEIKLVNKGFSDIKFLDILLTETEEFKIISNPEVYIGVLDSDDYETAEYTIMVSKDAKDEVTLPLQVEYRDANGKLYTKEIPLTLELFTGAELKQRTNGGGFPWGIIILIIIIVAVGVYIYRRKKRKKKG